VAILKSSFDDESVSPLGLLLAALPPTCRHLRVPRPVMVRA
jgi:hypothetical protein